MITREDYNKALDIVESYHEQLFKENNSIKTYWQNWSKLDHCSIRLRNGILRYPNLYLEDITPALFNRLRNVGKKSWYEFVKLRGY